MVVVGVGLVVELGLESRYENIIINKYIYIYMIYYIQRKRETERERQRDTFTT